MSITERSTGEMKPEGRAGAELDYWVGRAEGIKWVSIHERPGVPDWCALGGDPNREYSPSSDWAQGGPIIERERIHLTIGDDGIWESQVDRLNIDAMHPICRAETPLVAAMRAYVASKLKR